MMIFLLALLLLISIGGIYLAYTLLKALGYPKLGTAFVVVAVLVILGFAIVWMFPDEFYTKNDARDLLRDKEGIVLYDDFKLVDYESSWSIGDLAEELTLEISDSDKVRLLEDVFNGGTNVVGGNYMTIYYHDSTNRSVSIYLSVEGNRLVYDSMDE